MAEVDLKIPAAFADIFEREGSALGRTAGLLLLLSLTGCAISEPLPAELEAFRFEGKPIHPAILDAFIPWLSDGEPVIAAVDLEGFTRSGNRLNSWRVEEKERRITGVREGNGGYLWYWHLGQGRSGSHFVEVHDCGGGSGVWKYLVQLRFEVVEAFGSRRILLRCENVESIRCCPQGMVEPALMPEPCPIHPRPFPTTEPKDIPAEGPALADARLSGQWSPLGRYCEVRLGGFKLFAHSIFFERVGIIPFEIVSTSEGRCLLRLAEEVESCRFLRISPHNEFAPVDVEIAFFSSLDKARAAVESKESADAWGIYVPR